MKKEKCSTASDGLWFVLPGAESIIASDLFPACDAPRSSAPLADTVRHVPKNRRGSTRKKEKKRRHCARIEREREASRRIDTAMIVGGVDPHLRSARETDTAWVTNGVLPRGGSGRSRISCKIVKAWSLGKIRSILFYDKYILVSWKQDQNC